MSIRVRLTIIILSLIAIPLLIVSAVTFSNYKDSLTSSRLTQLRDVARFKADRIEAYFAKLRDAIDMAQEFHNIRLNLPLLERFDLASGDSRAAAAKKMLDLQLPGTRKVLGLSNIMLADNDGTIRYAADPRFLAANASVSLAAVSPAALAEGRHGVYLSDIIRDESRGNRPEMLLTAPASDLNGAHVGVIVFEIDMAPLYALVADTTGLRTTGEVLLGKKSGDEVVYLNPLRHDPSAALNRRVRLGDRIAIPIQKAVAGETGCGLSVDYRGKQVVAAWTPIPSLGWGLVAKIDAKEEFAAVTSLLRLLMLVLAVVLVMACIITFSVAQSISVPIQRLSQGAEIIGSGNLDFKVGMDLHDEIGRLSRSFDKMTHDLKTITASRDDLNKEIANRTKAEEALRHSAEDLARSNKDLEQFAYVASHDLQEPLRAVAGFMGLLKNEHGAALDAEAREYIDLSIDGAERMQTLVNDLLAYSRVGTRGAAFGLMRLQDALDAACTRLHASITESDARVTSGELPSVNADASQMTQLLQNLIGNAIKFHGERRPEVHVSAERADGCWRIGVRDNGIGIEPRYFDRIFLIFQRLHTRSEYKGTGIGLAICKKIVERHGGSLWVESKPNEGSVFYFTIPDKGGEQ